MDAQINPKGENVCPKTENDIINHIKIYSPISR